MHNNYQLPHACGGVTPHHQCWLLTVVLHQKNDVDANNINSKQ
jgi:hypothetical protein